MTRLTPYIPMIFVLLWSTGFIGAKFGLPFMEPFFLLVVRYLLVLALFGLGMMIWQKRWIARTDIPGQLLIGVLLHGVYLAGVFYSISVEIPAGLVAIIVGIQPILTATLGSLWLGQPVGRVQMTGLALGFAGIVLVIAGAGALTVGQGGLDPIGLAATLAALMGISLGTALQKRFGGHVPVLAGSITQYAGALLFTVPFTLMLETQTVQVTAQLVLTMVWLVLGLSVLAIGLLMVMIRAGEVAQVASYFYLVPPLTVLQAWVYFGETLSVVSLLGGLLAVAGVYLVIRKPRSGKAATLSGS